MVPGYGVYVGEEGGRRLVAHPGTAAGFAAFLETYPDDRSMFAVLSNVESTDILSVRGRLAGILFP